jgi:hypothetical protein
MNTYVSSKSELRDMIHQEDGHLCQSGDLVHIEGGWQNENESQKLVTVRRGWIQKEKGKGTRTGKTYVLV